MTEKELMKLVADYGKECISAGIAEMSLSDTLKQRMADDVRKSHDALTARLRALLTELEAAREDAARYRWMRNEARKSSPKISIGIWGVNGNSHCGKIGSTAEEVDLAIDAARKGKE